MCNNTKDNFSWEPGNFSWEPGKMNVKFPKNCENTGKLWKFHVKDVIL